MERWVGEGGSIGDGEGESKDGMGERSGCRETEGLGEVQDADEW